MIFKKIFLLVLIQLVSTKDLPTSRRISCTGGLQEDGSFLESQKRCRIPPADPYGRPCDVQKYFTRFGKQIPFTNQGGLWGPSWKVSFELFINSYTRGYIAPDGYANIFHITATGNECCSIGDRYPAFLTNRNGFIHFATQIGDRGNAFWDSPQLPPRVWYGIEAEQRFKNGKWVVEVRAGRAGENPLPLRAEIENPKPRQYKFVTVYTGFRSAADARIRNLNFGACNEPFH